MLKPHTILLLSAFLALCAAVFLVVAHHEPKAALAAGYALLAGVTSLALYLSNRQKAALEDKPATARQPGQAGDETAQRSMVTAPNKSRDRHEPRYTSHSRA